MATLIIREFEYGDLYLKLNRLKTDIGSFLYEYHFILYEYTLYKYYEYTERGLQSPYACMHFGQ